MKKAIEKDLDAGVSGYTSAVEAITSHWSAPERVYTWLVAIARITISVAG